MRHVLVRIPMPLLISTALLAGCAGPRAMPLAGVPATLAPPRPIEPAGLPSAAQVPPLGPDGRYRTPGYATGPAGTMWAMRAALNVAVLSCRDAGEATQAAAYNAVLARQKAQLAAAYKAVQAQDRQNFGATWQAEHDARMTRLYNFYAQPFAKADFCVAARAVLARAGTVVPADFSGFTASALPELEAPFVTGYRRYAAYRQDAAAWKAAQAPGAAPRLTYAELDAVIDWSPRATRLRMASRR